MSLTGRMFFSMDSAGFAVFVDVMSLGPLFALARLFDFGARGTKDDAAGFCVCRVSGIDSPRTFHSENPSISAMVLADRAYSAAQIAIVKKKFFMKIQKERDDHSVADQILIFP